MSNLPDRRPSADGPDYSDLSNTVVAYRWVSRRQGWEPGSRDLVIQELADGLAQHAARQGARLIGAARGDFPTFRTLPRDVRRELLRAMRRQERWWRFGGLVLVRIWQRTEPLGTAEAGR